MPQPKQAHWPLDDVGRKEKGREKKKSQEQKWGKKKAWETLHVVYTDKEMSMDWNDYEWYLFS